MTKSATILIVDDEKNTCDGLARYLSSHAFDVHTALNAEAALEFTQHQIPDLILSDLRMGDGLDGVSLMHELKHRKIQSIVVLMTAYGTVESAVSAMQEGAYNYLTKPINLDELLIVIRKALSLKILENENRELKEKLRKSLNQDIVLGKSIIFKKVFDEALRIANSNASVLIEGESGTGKELIAQLIHDNSKRREFPFVTVHCAALSEHLLESELFGHEKGAFTGATERKIGRFEKADKGTIFLDEIGEIDHRTQVKLLRVLQDGEFERVGGGKTLKINLRIIAATNKRLQEEVEKGNFREDLYYRIKVIVVEMPPLRKRTDDINEIFDFYVNKFSMENHKVIHTVDADVYKCLNNYPWPGNIRELKNVAERIIVLMQNQTMQISDLPHDIRFASNERIGEEKYFISNDGTMSEMEKEAIRRKLLEVKGNKSKAAKQLGISRRTLYRKIDEYGF